jgi:hypothetical protein
MVVIGMTAENQLLSFAFALIEGENNESWSWFLRLVRKEVVGLGRSIFMISDCHRGLLNGAKDPIEGYPPLIHRWYSCHFATNIWMKQRSDAVILVFTLSFIIMTTVVHATQLGRFTNEATNALSHPLNTVASHSVIRAFAKVSMVSIFVLYR